MRQADGPLQKITMNIFKSDYEFLESYFGQGWQTLLRTWIQQKVRETKEMNQ